MYFDKLDPLFHEKTRLGILTILLLEEDVDFSYLKEKLNLTDGNLASHLKVLEQANVIVSRKTFINKKPKTFYRFTEEGKKRFLEYINNLKKLLFSL